MDTAQIETGTAIALPAPIKLEAILKERAATDDLLKQIVAAGDAEFSALSADTKNGRTALIALSNKASTTRAEAKRHRLALTEQWRSDTAAVNACGKVLDDGLAAARDKWRAPVTAWEEMEATRIQRLKDRLTAIDAGRADALCPSSQIEAVLFEIEAMEIGADWAEYREIAEAKRKTVIGALQGNLAAARDREAQQAELAQLRAEAAARAEADRIREAEEAAKRRAEAEEADRKRAAEAKAEADRVAAERAEANRIAAEKAETERQAQIERDKAEAAERARIEAEQRAAKEKADAEARHVKELAEAKAREDAAAQAERDRIAAQAKAEADARAKREADQAHRQRIRDDIATSMNGFTDELTAVLIADAMMDGAIPHLKVLL